MTFIETSENDPNVTSGVDFTADTGHTLVALSRLIERWRAESHPNMAAFVTMFGDQVQEFEDAFWAVLMQRSVTLGTGVQLDVIGRLVGQARNGLSDEAYRAHLNARMRINRSNGTANDVIEVAQLIDSVPFHLTESGTAHMSIWYEAPNSNVSITRELPVLLNQARAAGVGLLISVPTDATRGGIFGSSYDLALNADRGWSSSYDSSVGGLFAHAIR